MEKMFKISYGRLSSNTELARSDEKRFNISGRNLCKNIFFIYLSVEDILTLVSQAWKNLIESSPSCMKKQTLVIKASGKLKWKMLECIQNRVGNQKHKISI